MAKRPTRGWGRCWRRRRRRPETVRRQYCFGWQSTGAVRSLCGPAPWSVFPSQTTYVAGEKTEQKRCCHASSSPNLRPKTPYLEVTYAPRGGRARSLAPWGGFGRSRALRISPRRVLHGGMSKYGRCVPPLTEWFDLAHLKSQKSASGTCAARRAPWRSRR